VVELAGVHPGGFKPACIQRGEHGPGGLEPGGRLAGLSRCLDSGAGTRHRALFRQMFGGMAHHDWCPTLMLAAVAVALHFMYYNFVKIHSSIRMTPTMAAGVTERLWEMSDVVALLEAAEKEQEPIKRAKQRSRKPNNRSGWSDPTRTRGQP